MQEIRFFDRSTPLYDLLKFKKPVALTPSEMAKSLTVTFFPPHEQSETLRSFSENLRTALAKSGVQILPYPDALDPEKPGKVKPGIVIIEQGEGKSEDLAIHHVSGLYQNPLVAIYDSPVPVRQTDSLQEILDAITGVLAWNMTHIPIFASDDNWTFCTMNGAVVDCSLGDGFQGQVLNRLIPKLAAQVIPPQKDEFIIRHGALDLSSGKYDNHIEDLFESSRLWKQNGLMLSHTSVNDLKYRGTLYRRIVSSYLDGRTGMSYGFLARQLPTHISPALKRSEHPESETLRWTTNGTATSDGKTLAKLHVLGEEWIVPIPDVWVLGTRSGCDKANLDPAKDLIRLGLEQGTIILETPRSINEEAVRPSYDTLAILAHCLGNAVVASILLALDENAYFPRILSQNGLTLSHWHGYLKDDAVPTGYVSHGANNPPVSCSTSQSAIYAFAGKIRALEAVLSQGLTYRGDIHLEPHHGLNVIGTMSLSETARWADKCARKAFVST